MMEQTRFLLVRVVVASAALVGNWLDASALQAGFESRTLKDESGEHRYQVFLPNGYSTAKKWPVVLFLHGAGERGRDGQRQTMVGLGPALRQHPERYPFVAVFPQCEDVDSRYLSGWLADTPDGRRALTILAEAEREFSIDSERRLLTGWSMGGYGSWSIAAANPAHWAGVMPLAGGGEELSVESLKDSSVWAFHGSIDAAILPRQSRNLISALKDAGGNPRYTEVTGGVHDICPTVYGNEAIIRWMANPKGDAPQSLTLGVAPGSSAEQSPFLPAMDLNGAVTVRLGNEMLDALAISIPELIPKDLLSGQIGDIYDSTVVEGYQFSITFGGINYWADLKRIRITGWTEGRLNIQIAVQNARLRIGWTSVRGSSHSASTGPIDVVIGQNAPVWLSFDVTPYIENRRLRLRLIGSRFDIPWDNWYVTSPAGVQVSGFGMTREKVANGLTSGLYGNKGRIEAEVRAIVPKLVAQMESQLQLNQANGLVNSFWPLPVFQPRVRVWPQDVSVDDMGVSIVLGATAATLDYATAPTQPAKFSVTDVRAVDVEKSEHLKVGVAPDMLRYLTQMLVDDDLARINTLDIPEKSFAAFSDRAILAESIPDLASFDDATEVRSVLHMTDSLRVVGGEDDQAMPLSAPNLKVEIATRQRGTASDWQPYATLTVSVRQDADVSLAHVDNLRRAVKLGWSGNPDVTLSAAFAPGHQPGNTSIDTDRLTALFQTSWLNWTALGPATQTIVPDLNFGLAKLRLSDVGWHSPFMGAVFKPPGVRITNSADEPLVYETKGPFSDWGGPYKLDPGKSHMFPVSYPLTWQRRVDGRVIAYTLDAGSHSEFRKPEAGGPPSLFKAREGLRTGDTDTNSSEQDSNGSPVEPSKEAAAARLRISNAEFNASDR